MAATCPSIRASLESRSEWTSVGRFAALDSVRPSAGFFLAGMRHLMPLPGRGIRHLTPPDHELVMNWQLLGFLPFSEEIFRRCTTSAQCTSSQRCKLLVL